MSITNERLRELSIDEWTWASNIEERMAIARELLAARERIAELTGWGATERTRAEAAIARADGLAADLAACVVRAEKAEAEHKAAQDAGKLLYEATQKLMQERDAARAEVERLRAELASEEHRGIGRRLAELEAQQRASLPDDPLERQRALRAKWEHGAQQERPAAEDAELDNVAQCLRETPYGILGTQLSDYLDTMQQLVLMLTARVKEMRRG